ncbi:glutathione S-transferase [Methylomonas koyamae]|uniref:Glutathione S-transferase n=1 Tax=Methylomonas koyamae TaxID=702114 RepID=A0A177N3B1_9GAMM|nr:glutathione S-transferase [Methylomonas koyamae]
MLKLYMTPGSCSTGIHILLEELELVFEAHIVNLLAGDQHRPEFLALNPKATIPVLVKDDGSALTEFQAIAYWLARKYPKAGLLAADADRAAHAIELMDYVVATIHGQGFQRLFVPEKYAAGPAEYDRVKRQGTDIVNQALALVARSLPEQGYALGDFGIADAALFYVEFWADKSGIDLPDTCRKHYRLMLSRPAVRRVLMEEGYRPG